MKNIDIPVWLQCTHVFVTPRFTGVRVSIGTGPVGPRNHARPVCHPSMILNVSFPLYNSCHRHHIILRTSPSHHLIHPFSILHSYLFPVAQ